MKKLLLLKTLILLAAIASAQIIHVPADYPTIQEGIDAATHGDTVLVANGTWFENITFKGKAITLTSNYIFTTDTNDIHNTIIDGSMPDHPDTASVVRFVNGEDTTSILKGFTITGGKGTDLSPSIFYRAGGGILCLNSGAKIVDNYICEDSLITSLQGIGGGIYGGPNGSNAYLVIKNNRIIDNYIYSTTYDYFATGAAVGTDCHCIIQNNIISYNTSIAENNRASAPINCRGFNGHSRYTSITNNVISNNLSISRPDTLARVFGGAIYLTQNYGIISNNTVKNNTVAAYSSEGRCLGAGITVLQVDTSFIVSNNIIMENKFISDYLCWGGGLFIWNSTPKVFNNLICYNEGTNGGGVAIQDNNPEKIIFFNNTVVNNTGSWGGGMWIFEDSTIIFNNIIFDNNAEVYPSIYDIHGGVSVNYCDIEQGWLTGEGNFSEDPMFSDDLFHLNCNIPSPCINSGTDEIKINGHSYYAPAKDYEGDSRPLDDYFDIGADEQMLCTSIAELGDQDNPFKLVINPNPSSGAAHLRYSIFDTRYSIFEVYSSDGVMVKSQFWGKQPAGEYTIDLDLSDLPDGIYFIRMRAGEMVETAKVILLK